MRIKGVGCDVADVAETTEAAFVAGDSKFSTTTEGESEKEMVVRGLEDIGVVEEAAFGTVGRTTLEGASRVLKLGFGYNSSKLEYIVQ